MGGGRSASPQSRLTIPILICDAMFTFLPLLFFPCFLSSFLSSFLSFLSSFLPFFPPSFLPSFLPFLLPFFLPSFLPSFLPFFLPSSLLFPYLRLLIIFILMQIYYFFDAYAHTPELIWAEDPISLRCWGTKTTNLPKMIEHVTASAPCRPSCSDFHAQ